MGKHACIFGASGGIGGALVEQLVASGNYHLIHAGSRSGTGDAARPVSRFAFDLGDERSIAAVAGQIAQSAPLDLVIIATGVLHLDDGLVPEKTWQALDPAAMAEVFANNTIGPAMIAKHFLPLLRRDHRTIFAALSAKVGSISDNHLGGWHSYRASKAALNMLVQNFAIELGRRNPQAIAVTLHPGTVDTVLSQPFQRNVAPGQLFTPAQSAAHLLGVIDGLSLADNGGLFAWDGTRIPF